MEEENNIGWSFNFEQRKDDGFQSYVFCGVQEIFQKRYEDSFRVVWSEEKVMIAQVVGFFLVI